MIFGKSATLGHDAFGAAAAVGGEIAQTGTHDPYISALRARDADAFDALVNRYSPEVFALLNRLTNDREEAADLTQETFLRALRSIADFRGESTLKTWLFRIAINESRNRFRWWKRRRRDSILSLDSNRADGETRVWETLPDNSISPEDEVLRRERSAALVGALATVKAAHREVIVLCDIEGFTYEECALALGTNVGTVKSRLSRGRDELRRKIKGF
jgi:RNA polymerase sigma-70 factor, ECF subfamily